MFSGTQEHSEMLSIGLISTFYVVQICMQWMYCMQVDYANLVPLKIINLKVSNLQLIPG